MRVVAGKARGRKLLPVPGSTTRPILDRVKTALFDILRPRIEGARVWDMFAGSGGVGIEALSQGAATCVFTDLESKAIDTIRKNLETTKLGPSSSVKHIDAFRYLRHTKEQFDLIYIAPPQYKGLWIEALHHVAERPEIVSVGGVVIIQIDPREEEDVALTEFQRYDQRKYGNSLLLFFERKSPNGVNKAPKDET